MRKLILLVLLASAAFAQTAINDTLYLQSAAPWTGQITVSWPAFVNAAGTSIARGSRTYAVNVGVVSITLYATEGASPSFAYAAKFRTMGGANSGQEWAETWSIPASPSIVTLRDVKQTSTLKFFPSQIAATGKSNGTYCIQVASEAVTGLVGCAGGPGGGGTWGTIVGAIADQVDLKNALDAKAASTHGHAIAQVTSLQPALDGKADSTHGHAIADTTGLQSALNAKEATANKGAANGYAPLDAGGKVPAVNLPSSSGMTAVVQDVAPQLGGDIDMNGHAIQTVTPVEMARVHGVTSAIQDQIDGKSATGHNHAGTYEPVDASLLRQANLAGTGAATTPARSDHNHDAALALKANLASPALTGVPTAPTAAPGTNTTQVASTAFVKALGDTKAASNASTTVNGQTCALGSTCTITVSGVVSQTTGIASALPATCTAASASVLQFYYATDTTDHYFCGATNTWLRILSTLPSAAFSMSGTEQSALATPAAGAGACWFDSTEHGLNCKFNNSATVYRLTSLSTTVLGYLSGITSAVQGQIDGKVPTTRTVNGKALSANVTLVPGDITGATATIASGTSALGTAAIASGACATVVTTAATGAATTDAITWTPNADITAVTGYAPVTTGGLAIYPYPTANNVNWKVCNPTSASITPGAVTLNWRISR